MNGSRYVPGRRGRGLGLDPVAVPERRKRVEPYRQQVCGNGRPTAWRRWLGGKKLRHRFQVVARQLEADPAREDVIDPVCGVVSPNRRAVSSSSV